VISLNYRQLFILKHIKTNFQTFTLNNLYSYLKNRDFNISKLTLSKYLDIFAGMGFIDKVNSFCVMYNINYGYFGWDNSEIKEVMKCIK
jgi:Fe2+ or Zn2+ uptake regulation protein